MSNLILVEWYFILIVFLPTGDITMQQFGRFDSKANCETIQTILPMKFPASYIRFDIIPCWKNTIKIIVKPADKDKHEAQE